MNKLTAIVVLMAMTASCAKPGADPDDALEVVGLPSMKMAEKATQIPVAPPGWVPAPPAAPPDSSDADKPDTGDDELNAQLVQLVRAHYRRDKAGV